MIYFVVTRENASITPLFVMDMMTVETLVMNKIVVRKVMCFSKVFKISGLPKPVIFSLKLLKE